MRLYSFTFTPRNKSSSLRHSYWCTAPLSHVDAYKCRSVTRCKHHG